MRCDLHQHFERSEAAERLERLELLEPAQDHFELLNLELLNRRKALNAAKRLNPSIELRAGFWSDWNRLSFALERPFHTDVWNGLNGARR